VPKSYAKAVTADAADADLDRGYDLPGGDASRWRAVN
jgi:hypothetical protein